MTDTTITRHPAWLGIFVAIPALGLAVIVAVAAAYWSRMPNVVAVHWGGGGGPDGSMTRWVAFAVPAVILTGAWIFAAISLRRPSRSLSGGAALVGFMSGIMAAVSALIVNRNLDIADWQQAGDVTVAMVLVPLLAGGVGAGMALWLESKLPRPEAAAAGAAPVVALPPGRVAWIGTATSKSVWLIVVALAASALFTPVIVSAILLVLVIVVAQFGRVTLTVSEDGVRWAAGALQFPRGTYQLTEIASATVLHINPLEYGGWGYRKFSGGTAVVVRRGEGVAIDLVDGARRIVAIDGAEEAAGVINALVQRRRAAAG